MSQSIKDKEYLLRLYETMYKIRVFEANVERLFFDSIIPGSVHLYIGEEAIATGVCANLGENDYITSTHRGHGHCIAKGAKTNRMMAELFGKITGSCKGKGGSMHVAEFDLGILGANGVVGGGFTIATGAGLSIKMRKTDQVVVCFFGDGASNRGTFHEAVNMASIWKLPVLFVCENNQWASTTRYENATPVSIAQRATAYGISGQTIDGNDVLEVLSESQKALDMVRKGNGPFLLECLTYRMKGHFVGDPEPYRTSQEIDKHIDNCPIKRYSTKLLEDHSVSPVELEAIRSQVEVEIEEAIIFAHESPWPKPEDAMEDLFSAEVE